MSKLNSAVPTLVGTTEYVTHMEWNEVCNLELPNNLEPQNTYIRFDIMNINTLYLGGVHVPLKVSFLLMNICNITQL